MGALTRARSEAEVLRAILAYLATRGDVVAWRANTGASTIHGAGGKVRHVRFGFRGCPDIVGYLVRAPALVVPPAFRVPVFLAIEVKAEGKTDALTPEQRAFLERVSADGGIAVVADRVSTVVEALR